MVIKEYPGIKKGDKVIVNKTNINYMIENFVEQMQIRGISCMSYFIDKKSNEEENAGISWTRDFDSNDVLNLVMTYVSGLSDREKLAFSTQLHNIVISEVISDNDEEEYYDS